MKRETMITILVPITLLALAIPAFAVQGPVMNSLQYNFYVGTGALFTALVNGDIDLMGWPLSKSQYDIVKVDPNIVVAPYLGMDINEIAFNNNYSNAYYYPMIFRNPFNYTEFRQAMCCLIDKDGLLAGPTLNGFGTRIDTQVPRPMLEEWVISNVSKYDSNGLLLDNYPWDYDPYLALQILYDNDWYDTAIYPTFGALTAAYESGDLEAGGGTSAGAVYPPGHEMAGMPLDNVIGYSRSDIPSLLAAGRQFFADMKKCGIPGVNNEGSSGFCYDPTMVYSRYSFYTACWEAGAKPNYWYSIMTPVGIYPGGPNFYLVNDAEMTYHAEEEYYAATWDQAKFEAYNCQYVQVWKAFCSPLYTTRAYMAYRTSVCGVINARGYGLTANLDWTMQSAYPSTFPNPDFLRYGTLNPPEAINPIFSSWLWDYQVVDRMFTSYMGINPYKPTQPGKTPTGGDTPYMAYDWETFTYAPDNNIALHLWFRSDVQSMTWHDGTPVTVYDWNYTRYLHANYPDSNGYTDMIHVVDFDAITDDECIIYFDNPSIFNLYAVTYDIVPMHIYELIPIPDPFDPEYFDRGHHGYWPGANEGFEDQETWVGCNYFMYLDMSLVQGEGGGITLVAFDDFWWTMMPGDIDFNYYWDAGPAPQGGEFRVGLSDLVLLANAYGTSGTGDVPFSLGKKGDWEPGCDLAAPSGIVGLSDLVTLAKNYGGTWGEYP